MTVRTLPKIERQTITIPAQICAYSGSDVISMYLRRYAMTFLAVTVYIFLVLKNKERSIQIPIVQHLIIMNDLNSFSRE